jgi:hypothetical protein
MGADFSLKLSKLDLGIMGFLWCQGSKEEKAEYMFNLSTIYRITNAAAGRGSANSSMVMESSPDFLVWTNRNLKYIFKRMF